MMLLSSRPCAGTQLNPNVGGVSAGINHTVCECSHQTSYNFARACIQSFKLTSLLWLLKLIWLKCIEFCFQMLCPALQSSTVFIASCIFNSDTEKLSVQHGCLRPGVSDLQQGDGEQPWTWQVPLWCCCSCAHSSCVLQPYELENMDLVHISACLL